MVVGLTAKPLRHGGWPHSKAVSHPLPASRCHRCSSLLADHQLLELSFESTQKSIDAAACPRTINCQATDSLASINCK
ncbi:unnamed protein product [Closterium sp. NIES-65]|nr:unnamed protein product [Closterium sp. NIES-65]